MMRKLILLSLLCVLYGAEDIKIVPNPLSNEEGVTTIIYRLPNTSLDRVKMEIYDIFGNLVYRKEVMSGEQGAIPGQENTLTWNGRNGKGEKVASGVYILIIRAYQGNRVIFNKKERVGVAW
jgi:flagellar hook assembly protein FlgD